jgi:glycosyltransferase involved in cell wall biosynthesis
MNLLIYSENEVSPNIGGTERATHVLAGFLKKNNYQIFYLINNQKPRLNNSFFFPNNRSILANENITFLSDLIEEKSIDVVLLTTPSFEVYQILQKIKKRVVIVTVIHASIKEYLPFFSKMFNWKFNNPRQIGISIIRLLRLPWLYLRLKRKIEKKLNVIFQYSSKVVVLSGKYMEDILELRPKLPRQKIYSIENFNPYENENVEISKNNQVIFVGRLIYLKRIDQILLGWKNIKKLETNWKLLIIGDGDEEINLKKMVKTFNINNVLFLPNQDPRMLYKSSKIICLTSVYEGLPMVLLEALHYGVVPIVYNTFGSASDIITHGENGFLVEPFNYKQLGEYISLLQENPEMLNKMSLKAIEKSRQNDNNTIALKWCNMLSAQ